MFFFIKESTWALRVFFTSLSRVMRPQSNIVSNTSKRLVASPKTECLACDSYLISAAHCIRYLLCLWMLLGQVESLHAVVYDWLLLWLKFVLGGDLFLDSIVVDAAVLHEVELNFLSLGVLLHKSTVVVLYLGIQEAHFVKLLPQKEFLVQLVHELHYKTLQNNRLY